MQAWLQWKEIFSDVDRFFGGLMEWATLAAKSRGSPLYTDVQPLWLEIVNGIIYFLIL